MWINFMPTLPHTPPQSGDSLLDAWQVPHKHESQDHGNHRLECHLGHRGQHDCRYLGTGCCISLMMDAGVCRGGKYVVLVRNVS